MQIFVDQTHALAESPVFFEGKFFWVDYLKKTVFYQDPLNKKPETLFTHPDSPIVILPQSKKDFLIALNDKIILLSKTKHGDEVQLLCDDFELNQTRLNDGKQDPWGNLIIGSTHHKLESCQPEGKLFKVDQAGQCQTLLEGVHSSNGICFNSDASKLYHVDTFRQTVTEYDYGRNHQKLSDGRVVYRETRPEVYPDGMCMDDKGYIWLALWNGAQVVCFDPATKKILSTINLPCSKVTSCCLNPDSSNELVITSANFETSQKLFPDAGKIFKVDCHSLG